MMLKITNPKNGLIKIINAQNYKMFEVLQTFKIYMKAGFTVHVIDGLITSSRNPTGLLAGGMNAISLDF